MVMSRFLLLGTKMELGERGLWVKSGVVGFSVGFCLGRAWREGFLAV